MRKSVHEHHAAATAHGPAHRHVDAGQHDQQQQQHPLAPATPASLLHLQRTAGNQAVVQRVKDAFGENLANADLKLAPAFQNKHVAADQAGAIATTDWRYRNNKMPRPMEQGRMPNTVATSKTWLDALDASGTQVDTEDNKWTKGVAMDVATAWQVRWRPRTNDYGVTPVDGLALQAGGYGEAVYAAGKKKGGAKQVLGGKFLVDHIENA